ncbi:MAG: PAS domain-containing protein, partial [Desulfarculus sp.]|nr:PAS domain-containing protein [Desulfarculus sp.]
MPSMMTPRHPRQPLRRQLNRCRAELALRRRDQKTLDRFFLASQDLMWVLDHEGRILAANPAALKLLGFSQEQLRGRPICDLAPPEERERLSRMVQEQWPRLTNLSRQVRVL